MVEKCKQRVKDRQDNTGGGGEQMVGERQVPKKD